MRVLLALCAALLLAAPAAAAAAGRRGGKAETPEKAAKSAAWFENYGNKCEACRVLVEESLGALNAQVVDQLRETPGAARGEGAGLSVDSSRVVDEVCASDAYKRYPNHMRRACRVMLGGEEGAVGERVALALEGNYENRGLEARVPGLVVDICQAEGWCEPAAALTAESGRCDKCEAVAGVFSQMASRLSAPEPDEAGEVVNELCAETLRRVGADSELSDVCDEFVEALDDKLLVEAMQRHKGRERRVKKLCKEAEFCEKKKKRGGGKKKKKGSGKKGKFPDGVDPRAFLNNGGAGMTGETKLPSGANLPPDVAQAARAAGIVFEDEE